MPSMMVTVRIAVAGGGASASGAASLGLLRWRADCSTAGSYRRIRGSARDLRGRSNCIGAAAQRAVRRDCPGGRENRCKGPRADRDSGGGNAQPPVPRPGVPAQRSAELVHRHGYARESRVKPCGPNLAGKILNPSFTMPLKLLFTRSGACTKNTQKYEKAGRLSAARLTQPLVEYQFGTAVFGFGG